MTKVSPDLVNIYDESGEVAGVMEREEAQAENLILGAAVVFLFNPYGDVWLQVRRPDQDYPSRVEATACGAVDEGETLEDAAYQELRQEAGIDGMGQGIKLEASKPHLHIYLDGDTKRRRWKQIFAEVTEIRPEFTEETAGGFLLPTTNVFRNIKANSSWAIPSLKRDLVIAQTLLLRKGVDFKER